MRVISFLLLSVAFSACVSSTNPNRDLCVARAAASYQESIGICKSEKLNYDDCVMKYDIEKKFEKKQLECR